MLKLSKKKLRQLILKEIKKMEEDSIIPRHDDSGRQNYTASKGHHCHDCGYGMQEGDAVCEQCGSMYESELNEGDCGSCGSCSSCDDGSDYSIDTMGMIDDALGTLTQQGYDVDATKHDHKVGNHKVYKGSYMAKSHLYKVNKYSEKLYHMIPDGHNLEDWMRTKLAQIADDIGEVYHALDHDRHEGDV